MIYFPSVFLLVHKEYYLLLLLLLLLLLFLLSQAYSSWYFS